MNSHDNSQGGIKKVIFRDDNILDNNVVQDCKNVNIHNCTFQTQITDSCNPKNESVKQEQHKLEGNLPPADLSQYGHMKIMLVLSM